MEARRILLPALLAVLVPAVLLQAGCGGSDDGPSLESGDREAMEQAVLDWYAEHDARARVSNFRAHDALSPVEPGETLRGRVQATVHIEDEIVTAKVGKSEWFLLVRTADGWTCLNATMTAPEDTGGS